MKNILFLSLAVCILLTACAPAPTQTSEVFDTIPEGGTSDVLPTPTPRPTVTPTLTETAPAKNIVATGSEWAKAGVPVGLEIRERENVYFAVNAVGQEVEIGKFNISTNKIEYSDALKWKLAATREESINNKIPWEDANKGAANRVGKLIGQPFSKDVVTGQNIISTNEIGFGVLGWSPEATSFYLQHPDVIPGKIIGYFTTEYEGKTLWGKVVEWQTKDNGIIFLSMINATADYEHSSPQGKIFPIGLMTRPYSNKEIEPQSTIARNVTINNLLQLWIDNDSPPVSLQDYLLVGGIQ